MEIKILTNPSTSRILTPLSLEWKKVIKGVCSYKPEGYYFIPAVRERRWDGSISLFDMRMQSFPTGLLPRILNLLGNSNIDVFIEDESNNSQQFQNVSRETFAGVSWNTAFVPRDYQEVAAGKLLDKKRGIIKIATGGGKTLVAAIVINALQTRTLFLVDGVDLALQTKRALEKYLPGLEVGLIGDGVWNPKTVTVALLQTLAHGLGLVREKLKTAGGQDVMDEAGEVIRVHKKVRQDYIDFCASQRLVIYDEVHGAASSRGEGIVQYCVNAVYKHGLSATPLERGDNANIRVEAVTGQVLMSITSSELIRAGWLAKPTIGMATYDDAGAVNKSAAWPEVRKNCVVDNAGRHALVRRAVERELRLAGSSSAVLVSVVQIEHGHRLVNELQSLGEPVAFIKGSDPSEHREEVLENFRSGRVPILIGSSILNKGIDLPNMTGFVLSGPWKDRIQTQQLIGRPLHVAAPTVRITDIADLSHKYLKAQTAARLSVYREEPEYVLVKLSI